MPWPRLHLPGRDGRSVGLLWGRFEAWAWIGRYTHLIGVELKWNRDYRFLCHLRRKQRPRSTTTQAERAVTATGTWCTKHGGISRYLDGENQQHKSSPKN